MYVDAAEWKSTYMVGVWADDAGTRLWEAPPTVWNQQAAELLGVEKAVKMAAYRGMKELNLGVDNLAAVWAAMNRRSKIHHRDKVTVVRRIQQTLRWSCTWTDQRQFSCKDSSECSELTVQGGGWRHKTYLFNFSQSCSLRAFTGTHPVFRGMAHRPSVVGSTFRCLVSWTLRHGMASLYPDFTQTIFTFTQFAPPGRALLRTKGFCGASGEATAHGENLYADMVAAW